ncbi:MAG: hypothetical protein C5B49_03415 [Bdellovibrio sp.]|nr:MAG: hypothetical protein C5B49_03415 [Bdellovibrio sp.]
MRLRFDRGTLLLDQTVESSALSCIPELRWDARVSAYRAPAYRLASLSNHLGKGGYQVATPAFREWKASQVLTESSKNFDLRPYQEAALSGWEIAGRRGVVVLPTGAGKTHLAMAAIQRAQTSTLILVPTRVLLEQWLKHLEGTCLGPIGILGDGSRKVEAITVSTFESAYLNMSWLGDRFEFLIVDEVHHFGRGLRDEALEMSMAQLRLGLTATAPGEGTWRERVENLVGSIVYEIGINALRGEHLSDFQLIRVPIELTPLERALYQAHMDCFSRVRDAWAAKLPRALLTQTIPQGSWQQFVAYASRSSAGKDGLRAWTLAQKLLVFTENKRIALQRILKQHRCDRTLIFTADTATTYEIAREHLIMPITAEIGRQERDQSTAWFCSGVIKALVSCQVLNEGYDVPAANVAVILGGRRGAREHVQRIGRVLRWKGGASARIYELVCNRTIESKQAKRRGAALDS